jgi:hypothetical protein
LSCVFLKNSLNFNQFKKPQNLKEKLVNFFLFSFHSNLFDKNLEDKSVNALRVIKCEHEQLPQKISTLIPDR